MPKPKVGLLPFYLKLYDDLDASWRKDMQGFPSVIRDGLVELGLECIIGDICCVEAEFKNMVRLFEQEEVDAIVTLHLAYSPSLESIGALSKTPLPVIVLDTTPDLDFGPETSTPALIMNNHGIHGVQDFCNLLLRKGKPFELEAGHWKESDVLKRVAAHVRGARMASAMSHVRVGLIGDPFQGMGDFDVPEASLREGMGIHVERIAPRELARLLPDAGDDAVLAEIEEDKKRFTVRQLSDSVHVESVRVGLALRKLIERERLTACTICFLEVNRGAGLMAMPFLEISKAMERGIGYGGEGDVLTASLVSALLSVYPDASFTEMFCPDWKNNMIFLSHMGEMNLAAAEKKPVLSERKWTFSDTDNPAVATACFKPGMAVFVNLAPTADGYSLILAPVEVVSEGTNQAFELCIRGWFKPPMALPGFLESYSRAGGTHHAVLVYGDALSSLRSFGHMMGWKVVVID